MHPVMKKKQQPSGSIKNIFQSRFSTGKFSSGSDYHESLEHRLL